MRRREYAFLVAPSVIVMFGLLVIPLVRTVQWSFQQVRYGQPGTFVGLDNYRSALTDPRFASAVVFTVVVTVAVVTVLVVGGYVLAVLVNGLVKVKPLVLGLLLVPYVVPGLIGGTMFGWLFNSNFGGIVNQVIAFFGLPEVLWFTSTWANRGLVAGAVIWGLLPFAMLVILAGLQSVPAELLEAARVDGAGTLRTHWSVIAPSIRGVVGFVTLISIMDVLRLFDQLIPLSPQAVQIGNESLVLYIYNRAFLDGGQQLGLGSAMNVLLIGLIVVMLLPFIRSTAREGRS
ncbi:carbohydrate ABC transporter permease [Pseudokineococcus lusitanus]|uniref:Carbohydrate ABC transporter membrane protein 1 (CUT1 family) n=1 Tax=Pseudokineococcus lusitanus TaxID=763993 RepID=A0A3N1GWY7_9ACTN|nr:sugar ABC transporter permease [Pseudokineococcus lusitanus]ROP34758.1 carbohydrate ABC transporter membrane protein 1 (CUT1 family) [Pseudokineococcus lusitanus]